MDHANTCLKSNEISRGGILFSLLDLLPIRDTEYRVEFVRKFLIYIRMLCLGQTNDNIRVVFNYSSVLDFNFNQNISAKFKVSSVTRSLDVQSSFPATPPHYCKRFDRLSLFTNLYTPIFSFKIDLPQKISTQGGKRLEISGKTIELLSWSSPPLTSFILFFFFFLLLFTILFCAFSVHIPRARTDRNYCCDKARDDE